MGNECTNLRNDHNPCEIMSCVEKIKRIETNSASSSQLYFIKFKDNTKYNDEKVIKAVLKMFSDTDTGLNYEADVYKEIIRPLSDVCPNYVKCYAIAKNCNEAIMRNFIILESLKYSYSLAFFYSLRIDREYIPSIIFQTLCACYGLTLYKTNHNDLHFENILISKISNDPIKISYKIENNIYTIHTKYLVRIFDYDRSYSAELKENKSLNELNGYTNIFHTMKDVWHFINRCAFSHMIKDISLISKNKEIFNNYLKWLLLEDSIRFHMSYEKVIDNDFLDKNCCTIIEVLDRYSVLHKLKNEYKEGEILCDFKTPLSDSIFRNQLLFI